MHGLGGAWPGRPCNVTSSKAKGEKLLPWQVKAVPPC